MTASRRVRQVVFLFGASVALLGCHGLLDVSDPTLIRDGDIANVSGANAQRLNASTAFMQRMPSVVRDVAYFTDEWTMDIPVGLAITQNVNAQLDLRNSAGIEAAYALSDAHLNALSYAYWQTTVAIAAVRTNTPDSVQGDFLGQLYGLRGYLLVQMGEDMCPGFPVNDVVDNHAAYGGPVTTDSAFLWASATLDSALKYVRDSLRFVTLARVAKGRVLLDLGKYDEAAAMVAPVATGDLYSTEAGTRVAMSPSHPASLVWTALGNHEGTNGIDFVAAADPRIPLRFLAARRRNASDSLYTTTLGSNSSDSLVFASGVEARLIQAEAALHDGGSWKPVLDSLRATVGLDTLVDPGTPDARVDLLYRERAFWLFMTGRRLGDLRRLIRNYDRAPEDIFPKGTWLGGSGDQYGTATSIPFSFSQQHRYNPYITTGCTSR